MDLVADHEHPPSPAPPNADERERERTRAAFEQLNAVLTDVASSMLGKMHERCPYRAKDNRCTFAGGCVNQRRESTNGARISWCAGDHQLRRTRE